MTEHYAILPSYGEELVIPASRYSQETRVRVVKVARVKFWTVDADQYENYLSRETSYVHVREWRMDTGDEQGSVNPRRKIFTLDQMEARRRSAQARAYLLDAGVRLDHSSRLDLLTLANLIKKHLGEEEI